MSRLVIVFALLVLARGSAWAQAPVTPTTVTPEPVALTLETLERLALARHPSMTEAESAVEASRAQASQAGAWPNPTIAYVGDEISGGSVIRGGEHGVVFDQTIRLGGKLRLSRDALDAGVSEAEARRDRARLVVLTSVRTAFHEVIAAQLRVDVRRRLADVAAETRIVSAQLFNIGAVDRPDVLTSEIESTTAGLDVVEAHNALARAWTHLATAVADPALSPREIAGTHDSPLPELPRDQTLTAALAASPELAEARAQVTRAEREVALAKKTTFPDLLLRGGPRYNRELLEVNNTPVGVEWSVEAGLTVPLWDRNRAGVAAATSRIAMTKAAATALELRLIDRFATLYDEYATARRRAEAYRTEVLPKADEAYQLYLAKYGEMAASYPQVLMAQRTLFAANEHYLDAVEGVRTTAVMIQGLLTIGGGGIQ